MSTNPPIAAMIPSAIPNTFFIVRRAPGLPSSARSSARSSSSPSDLGDPVPPRARPSSRRPSRRSAREVRVLDAGRSWQNSLRRAFACSRVNVSVLEPSTRLVRESSAPSAATEWTSSACFESSCGTPQPVGRSTTRTTPIRTQRFFAYTARNHAPGKIRTCDLCLRRARRGILADTRRYTQTRMNTQPERHRHGRGRIAPSAGFRSFRA